MDKLSLKKGRRLAENWVDDHLRAALSNEPDDEKRRLLTTLYARQKGSLEYLSLIELDMGTPAAPEAEEPGRALALMMHPLVCLIPMGATLAFVIMNWQPWAVVAGIVTILQGLVRLIHPAFHRRSKPVLPEVHEPYLPESALNRFLQQQEDRIRTDAAGIAERQNVTMIKERRDVGEDAVELYCALYEAMLDTRDAEALSYPMSIVKMSLVERGLEIVPYSETTAALFDMMPSPDGEEMRWPAIRERENGAVVKRGLYLRKS